MITIDSLIGQMKNLFAIKTPVRFDTPEYNQFHCDLIQYIYENHFEESDEWKIISRNLVYTSTQRMAVGEGNTILIQLDALKRRELGLRFAVDWKLVHPDIIRVARSLYQDGHYFESARSAFIEINARVKKLFPELRGKDGKQLDGYPLMQASVYKGYKRDKIEMRGDRAEISDFPLYLNTVAGGLDRRDQTIGGFSFVVKIYALPVVEIIGQLLYLLGRYGFNAQFSDCL